MITQTKRYREWVIFSLKCRPFIIGIMKNPKIVIGIPERSEHQTGIIIFFFAMKTCQNVGFKSIPKRLAPRAPRECMLNLTRLCRSCNSSLHVKVLQSWITHLHFYLLYSTLLYATPVQDIIVIQCLCVQETMHLSIIIV